MALSSKERARAYRERMKKKGYRQVRFWVPDVNSLEFIEEARRQSRLIANSPEEKEDQAWVDAMQAETWANLPD